MERSLPAYALRHPVTVLMTVVTLVGLGMVCWWLLPIEFTIRIEFPVLSCWIPYPGATPEQVEQELAIPAEGEFMTIPRLESITSRSDTSGCYVVLHFAWDTDMRLASADLRDRVERLKLRLPGEIERIYMRKFGSMDWSILRFALFRTENENELAQTVRTELRNRLMRVEGVAEVEVSGNPEESVYVDFERNSLGSLNLSLYDIIQRLQSSSLNLALGRLLDGDSRYFVRAQNELRDARDMEDLIIGPNPVKLRDVATVTTRGPSGASSFAMDGKRGVFVSIVKESEANTVATCDAVRAELDRALQEPHYAGAELHTFHDQSEIIRFAIHSLMKAGVFGSVLALLVLFFFLRRLRATLLVALTAPTSLVSAFIYLYFRGMTLNIVTIASMIVSLGMLVDNAIVVLENIHRHNEMSRDRVANARRGAAEVALAITASTLTTIVVFVPVMYLESGELTLGIRTFAGPVTVSLLTSLLLALTVIPVAEVALRDRNEHPIYQRLSRLFSGSPGRIRRWYGGLRDLHIFRRIMALYGKAVGLTITHRVHAFAVIALVTTITAVIPMRRVGMQEMPSMDMRELHIRVNFEKDYGQERADFVFDHLEAIIEPQREALGIRNVYLDYGGWGGQIRLFLVQRQDLLPGQSFPYTTEQVREILGQQIPTHIPGGTVDLGLGQSGPTDTRTISARVFGDDAETAARVAEHFRNMLLQLPYVREASTDRERARSEMQLDVDEAMAVHAGLTPLSVARTVDFALRGVQLPYLRTEGREVPVRAQFSGEERRSKEDLESMEVAGASGVLVPLSNVTHIEKGYAPVSLNRENGKSVARVSASVLTANMTALREDMERLIAAVELPPGCSIQTGEEMSELERTMRNYHHALVLAVALIYLVMAAIFESVLLPFSILSTVPLAFLGVYWSLYLTGTLLDTVALIGALLMCGVVVNNGIVIVDHINQLRREGLDRHTAVTQAGINRFRPVMMTALTTILGCVPLAIGTGSGNDALNSLGRALVGGLTTSTFLTLLVVPLFYTFIDDTREWFVRYAASILRLGRRPSPTPETESPSVQ